MSDWSANPPPRGRRPQGRGYDYYRQQGAPPPTRAGGPAPPPPPRPPVGRQPAGPPPRPRKPKRWGRRIGVLLAVVVLLLGGLVVYFDSLLQRTAALDYEGRSADTPGTNWLVVGSDSREGLDESQREELSAGDAAGRRTDSMMLLHIPESGEGQPAMISLPRDSYVPIEGYGRDKLNSAFAHGGPQLLSKTVETATGVHIDHYAEIGLGGFADLVDAVGGVDMCLDQPMNDDMANVHLPAGCQELNGPTALGFARARYSLEGGDLERAENQRKLLSALVKKSTNPMTLVNPFRMFPLASSAGDTFLVNDGDHVWHLASLALAMGDLSGGGGITTNVPFGGFGTGSSGQSVVLWDKENASRLFEAIAQDQPIPPDLLD